MREPIPILDRLSAVSREHAEARERETSVYDLAEQAEQWRNRRGLFYEALTRPGLSVIAEHKRRSPSKGIIREDWGVVETITAYEQGGAAAISVLTEETRFGGSLEHLRTARETTDLPIIRKDFITTPYQLLEAKAAGADAALLIVGALSDGELRSLRWYADRFGLDTLIEVHDRDELERALAVEPDIIGINNRNLRHPELKTDLGTTVELLDEVPEGIRLVTESGFDLGPASRQRLRQFNAAGVDAVLIGEALMRSEHPAEAVRVLVEQGSSKHRAA